MLCFEHTKVTQVRGQGGFQIAVTVKKKQKHTHVKVRRLHPQVGMQKAVTVQTGDCTVTLFGVYKCFVAELFHTICCI